MKKLSFLLILLFSILRASPVLENKIGFLIVVSSSENSSRQTFQETQINMVDSIYIYYSKDSEGVKPSKILENQIFFEYRTEDVYFYCEKREIIQTQSGKTKFKVIK